MRAFTAAFVKLAWVKTNNGTVDPLQASSYLEYTFELFIKIQNTKN